MAISLEHSGGRCSCHPCRCWLKRHGLFCVQLLGDACSGFACNAVQLMMIGFMGGDSHGWRTSHGQETAPFHHCLWAPGPVQHLLAFPCSSLISRGHFGKKKMFSKDRSTLSCLHHCQISCVVCFYSSCALYY